MNNEQFLKTMGAKIKAHWKLKRYTLRQFGELCKLDYSCVCRIENGQYGSRIITLKTIADVLGVDVKEFL